VIVLKAARSLSLLEMESSLLGSGVEVSDPGPVLLKPICSRNLSKLAIEVEPVEPVTDYRACFVRWSHDDFSVVSSKVC